MVATSVGRQVSPYIFGYVGMCGPKGYGFSNILFIKRASILAILAMNSFSGSTRSSHYLQQADTAVTATVASYKILHYNIVGIIFSIARSDFQLENWK